MLLGTLGGAIAAIALLWYWQPAGPTSDEVAQHSSLLRELHQTTARLSERPLYPPLTESWRTVIARYEGCGLEARLLGEGSGGRDLVLYDGPVAAWHAQVAGPTARLLSCTLTLPSGVFVRPTSYMINGDRMLLTVAVLGREGTSIAAHPYNVSGDTQ